MQSRVEIAGALTLDAATAALAAGRASIAAASGDVVIDLAKVEGVDSAGLAVVFAWLRDVRAAGCTPTLANVPAQMKNLAAVYGAGDLLPLA
jgi:phospholipid transport system transporter-binding protein